MDDLRQLARDTGFRIEKISFGGGWFELLAMINLYFCKWLLGREMLFKRWFEKKRKKEFIGNVGWTNVFVKMVKIDDTS